MLTAAQKLRIRERVKALNPTPEQVRRYLETQAAKGNVRAQKALEHLEKANSAG